MCQFTVKDAKRLIDTDLPFDTKLRKGPSMHAEAGFINGADYEGSITFDKTNQIIHVYGKGKWLESLEGECQLNTLGKANETVCYSLTGYMSGFISTICGKTVLGKELECIGKGDQACIWELKLLKDWNNKQIDEITYLSVDEMDFEPNEHDKELIKQNKIMKKISQFEQKIIRDVLIGADLQQILDQAYREIKIPITVESLDFHIIAYSGMNKRKLKELYLDMQQHIKNHLGSDYSNKRVLSQLAFNEKTFSTTQQKRLVTTLQVHGKVIGYCTFIYHENETISKYDIDFLQRLSYMISTLFLIEKTKVNTLEKINGSFLRDIIDGRFQSEQEIIYRGNFFNIDLRLPFYICIVKYINNSSSENINMEIQEEVLRNVAEFFEKKNDNILKGIVHNNIVLLIPNECLIKYNIRDLMKKLSNWLSNQFSQYAFKIGISQEGNNIQFAKRHYDEALMAVRVANETGVNFFDTLGTVGVLLSSGFANNIHLIAKEQLEPLYSLEGEKKLELIKTLYVFLKNGGKLEQTMKELAISMSGLNYRIKSIENLLNKDLRQPDVAFDLYLLLKSLILLGELKID